MKRRNNNRKSQSKRNQRQNRRRNRTQKNQNRRRNRNQRQNKKSNSRRNQRQNRRRSQKRNLRGGAIPFSELGLAYDNAKFGLNSMMAPFQDVNHGVANNPASSNINPNPTTQFLSQRATDDSILGPDLKGTHDVNFPSV